MDANVNNLRGMFTQNNAIAILQFTQNRKSHSTDNILNRYIIYGTKRYSFAATQQPCHSKPWHNNQQIYGKLPFIVRPIISVMHSNCLQLGMLQQKGKAESLTQDFTHSRNVTTNRNFVQQIIEIVIENECKSNECNCTID